jgi:hypothetical protein
MSEIAGREVFLIFRRSFTDPIAPPAKTTPLVVVIFRFRDHDVELLHVTSYPPEPSGASSGRTSQTSDSGWITAPSC